MRVRDRQTHYHVCMKKSEALNILGLADGASDDEVKKAHREKVRANHPDRFTDPEKKASAEDKTKLINEARDVLLSRKWDPEYGPRTGGYGNPYNSPYTTYRPGTGGGQTGGQGYAWPGGFGWTGTYTSNGTGTGQNTGKSGYVNWGGIPFTYVWSWNDSDADGVFDPWEAIFAGAPRKTPEEVLDEAERQLNLDYKLLGGKLIMLLLCGLLGNLAIGMFMYALVTLVYAFYRNHRGCGSVLVLPFVMMIAPVAGLLAPHAGVQITGGSLVLFAMAFYYDIIAIRRDKTTRDNAKARISS